MKANMKKTLVSSAVTGALVVGAAGFSTAKAELSFNVGVFSDYLLDGASASENNAVVQGGVDWTDPGGLYLGTWLSTLADNEGQEVDLYLGYIFEAGGFEFDVGYIYYYYPELDDANYGEIYGYAGWGPVYFGIDYTINADDSAAEGDIIYRLGAEYEVMPTISLNGEIGYFDPDAGDADSNTFWQLGISKATTIGDFSLTYGSNDESGAQDLFVIGYTMTF
jgi:uncharacterized protein (TIGR02001 family)